MSKWLFATHVNGMLLIFAIDCIEAIAQEPDTGIVLLGLKGEYNRNPYRLSTSFNEIKQALTNDHPNT